MTNFSFVMLYKIQTSSFLMSAVFVEKWIFFIDVINLTDSKTCEETQLDFNNVITIHGFDEIENEEIVVSCINNYYWHNI